MKKTYIALLRAVNVVGANSLRMNDFVKLLGKIGLSDIRTYIQSGNAVFRSDESNAEVLAERIKKQIVKEAGFAPGVIVLKPNALKKAMTANPFPKADRDPKSLHLFFLADTPKKPDLAKLESMRSKNEQFTLRGKIFYFYAPDGVGRSKLFRQIEKALGAPCTARNWRSVGTILDLAAG